MSNLKSVALTVLELLAFNSQKFRGSRDRGHAHFRDCSVLTKYFLGMLRGSCSKFGEDRTKTELTILAVVVGWTDTGRMDTGRTDTLANLYSVQCIGQTITIIMFLQRYTVAVTQRRCLAAGRQAASNKRNNLTSFHQYTNKLTIIKQLLLMENDKK